MGRDSARGRRRNHIRGIFRYYHDPARDRRTAAEVCLRGMCLATLWSPFWLAMAVATQHLSTVPLWQIMALGLPMAACGLLLSHVMYASGVGRPVARGHGLESDYRVFFSAEIPYPKALEVNQNIYTKDDNILLVAVPAKGDVFEPSVLAALRDLTEASWKVSFATRVDGLTNFQNSTAQGDDLIVQSLAPKSGPVSKAAAKAARAAAMAEPLLVGRLITVDGSSTTINISLSLPQKELDEIPKAMAYVSDLVSKSHPDIRVATTGMVALNNAFVASSIEDLTFLVPLPVSLAALREQAQIPPRKQSGKSCAIS